MSLGTGCIMAGDKEERGGGTEDGKESEAEGEHREG